MTGKTLNFGGKQPSFWQTVSLMLMRTARQGKPTLALTRSG